MNYLQRSLHSVFLTLADIFNSTSKKTPDSYKIDWIGTHVITTINNHLEDSRQISSIEIRFNYIDKEPESYYFLNK